MKKYIVTKSNIYGKENFYFPTFEEAANYINGIVLNNQPKWLAEQYGRLIDINKGERGYRGIDVVEPYGMTRIKSFYTLMILR